MVKRSDVSSAALGALTNQQPIQSVQEPVRSNVIPNPFNTISDKMLNHTVMNPEFTGIARTVECYMNQGYNNFRVLTLHIEKGKVMKMDVSDPWANFETAAILENVSHISMIHLNNSWKDGKSFDK